MDMIYDIIYDIIEAELVRYMVFSLGISWKDAYVEGEKTQYRAYGRGV
jgi:hypothetical protein